MSVKRILLLALVALMPGALGAQLTTQTAFIPPIPLAQYAQGQAMMAQAAQKAALLDISFTFLDKTYNKDTHATDPLGHTYTTGCYRFKATSGFTFRMDVPQYTLTSAGLTITQNISRINADGLSARVRVVACQDINIGSGSE